MARSIERARPIVRRAGLPDLTDIASLAAALWPEETAAGHARHMRAILAGKPPSTLPLVLYVAEVADRVVGFIEVGLRSHADGCDGRRPVGFIEGWMVAAGHRRRGIGRALVEAAERWAAAQGCKEMASDTWTDNPSSQRAHRALGYEVVDRCVNFRKPIRPTGRSGGRRPG